MTDCGNDPTAVESNTSLRLQSFLVRFSNLFHIYIISVLYIPNSYRLQPILQAMFVLTDCLKSFKTITVKNGHQKQEKFILQLYLYRRIKVKFICIRL